MTFTARWRLAKDVAWQFADAVSELTEATAVDLAEAADGDFDVTAYFTDRPKKKDLASAVGSILDEKLPITIEEVKEQNWVEKSLATLAPVRAGRFLVHGAHDRHRRHANDVAVEIDAGQAFGTGHHGTTAGCLIALDRLRRRPRIASALDVGTGSGVLAIAIAKTWRVPVIATDIDPVAVRVAAGNARINRVAGLVDCVRADGLRHRAIGTRHFDLVVANILAGPLAGLATAIVRHLAPGGTLILSGLLPQQQRWIVATYRDRGVRFRNASVLDGWLTLRFEQPPLPPSRTHHTFG